MRKEPVPSYGEALQGYIDQQAQHIERLKQRIKGLEEHLCERKLLIESMQQVTEKYEEEIGALYRMVEQQEQLIKSVNGRLRRALTEDLTGAREQISLAHERIQAYLRRGR